MNLFTLKEVSKQNCEQKHLKYTKLRPKNIEGLIIQRDFRYENHKADKKALYLVIFRHPTLILNRTIILSPIQGGFLTYFNKTNLAVNSKNV